MKICLITQTLNPRTGAGVFAGSLMDGVKKQNPNMEFSVMTGEDFLKPNIYQLLKNWLHIRNEIKKSDLVHALDAYPYGVIACLANLGVSKPVIITVVGSGSIRKLNNFGWKPQLLRWAYGRATRVTAISRYVAQEIKKVLPDLSIEVINPGVDYNFYASKSDGAKNSTEYEYIVTQGEFKRRKGYEAILPVIKEVMLWRNHPEGNFVTRVAIKLADQVFCTSESSFTARFKKTILMPAGISTDIFRRNENIRREPNSILVFGRISPIKKLEAFVDACRFLKQQGVNFKASIVGDPLPRHRYYYKKLKESVSAADLEKTVDFKPGIPNAEAPDLYNHHEIYVNLTPAGSFDKTILEAMASGTVPVVSNRLLLPLVGNGFVFIENNASSLSSRLKAIFSLSAEEKRNVGREARRKVKKHHELSILSEKIFDYS